MGYSLEIFRLETNKQTSKQTANNTNPILFFNFFYLKKFKLLPKQNEF